MDTKDRNKQVQQRRKSPPSSAPRGGTAVHSRSRSAAATRAAAKTKTPKRRVRKPSPDVVYTQPEAFNRTRFLLRLATVVAVVIALVFGMSIFFKVETVIVSGMEKYTAWDIREASGIQDGENLLSISEPKISTRIQAALPYVNKVRVGIKLPGTVNIEIEELDVVYAAQAEDGSWWLLSADGTVVDKTNGSEASRITQILGVRLAAPQIGSHAVAAEPMPDQTQESEPTAIVTIKGSERLSAVISILQYLEEFGIIGDASSVDVTDMSQIELWYTNRYQVKLGDTTQLKYKVESMKKAIDQMSDYQTGILDVSFTTWPNEVGYNPFP